VEDGKGIKKPIKTGLGSWNGTQIEVLEGLQGGEHIVAIPNRYGDLFEQIALRERETPLSDERLFGGPKD
jgi:hypothetical protein